MTTDEGMKFAFISAATEESPYWDPMTEEEVEAIWDEWIARVRRDAAREALDGLAEDVRAEWDREHRWVASAVGAFRDKHYPEESA